MLLRISLIIALVAGIATFLLSHMQVATKISDLQTTLTQTRNDLTASETAREKAVADAKAANERADKLDRELTDTKEQLETQTARATQQEGRANRAETDLNKTRGELTEAQRNLAAWRALSIPVETVRERLVELERATKENAAITDENKVLHKNLTTALAKLAKYEGGDDRPPDMTLARNGRVLEVNPEWDFVVVDLGSNDGAVERGEMLINRDGKLVAKVRLSRVEEKQSVANVMAEWKQADPMVGDVVMK